MAKLKIFLCLVIAACSSPTFCQEHNLKDVKNFIGKKDTVKVCGKVFSGRAIKSSKGTVTLLNVGGYYPNQLLTVVIFEENLKKFPAKPEVYFSNANVCISGTVIDYNGKPEIVLNEINQINIQTSPHNINSNTVAGIADGNNAGTKTSPTQEDRTNSSIVASGKKESSAIVAAREQATPEDKLIAKDNSEILLATSVKLRSGPSLDFPVVQVLPAGSIVSILFTNKGWSKISIKRSSTEVTKSLNGYVENKYLKI